MSKSYLIHKIRSNRLTEMVSWSCIMMTLKSSVHSGINTNLKQNIHEIIIFEDFGQIIMRYIKTN